VWTIEAAWIWSWSAVKRERGHEACPDELLARCLGRRGIIQGSYAQFVQPGGVLVNAFMLNFHVIVPIECSDSFDLVCSTQRVCIHKKDTESCNTHAMDHVLRVPMCHCRFFAGPTLLSLCGSSGGSIQYSSGLLAYLQPARRDALSCYRLANGGQLRPRTK